MEEQKQIRRVCDSDSAYVRKARTLQDNYREAHAKIEGGWEAGKGPSAGSETCYGNMLLDGEKTGHNFLCKETFAYAKQRVDYVDGGKLKSLKRRSQTIEPYRLFCNMLSSQPMAFNLFHPLMRMLDDVYAKPILVRAFCQAFPALDIADVYSIDLEYLPVNYENYLGDKTAMDAVIRYTDVAGNRFFIAVEIKYTDRLGTNEASRSEVVAKAKALSHTLAQFAVEPEKYSQLYRNYLLAEAVRVRGDEEGPYKDCYTWILAPKTHPSTKRELRHLIEHLKEEYQYKVRALAGICLEDFVEVLIHTEGMPKEYLCVFEEFRRRYLEGLC